MIQLDDTWRARTLALPEDLVPEAHQLPFRLGLVRFPEEGWEGFWTFAPNRNPGRYALRADNTGAALAADAFDRAHHEAVFHGLLFDRLVDRQVETRAGLVRLRRVLLGAWVDTLAEACGSRAGARAAIAGALDELRRGTHLEMAALARRRLDVEAFTVQTRLKLRWCSLAPRMMAEVHHGQDGLHAIRRAYDLFGVATQCMDDALDAEDDARRHGVSTAELLHVEAPALVEAAALVTDAAVEEARRGGFTALGDWLGKFARFLRNATLPGDVEVRRRQGMAMARGIITCI